MVLQLHHNIINWVQQKEGQEAAAWADGLLVSTSMHADCLLMASVRNQVHMNSLELITVFSLEHIINSKAEHYVHSNNKPCNHYFLKIK
jgi:hypothetical protein